MIRYLLILIFLPLTATELTIASYNCGALPNHYDYLRAVCMGSLVEERNKVEPQIFKEANRIEELVLKNLLSKEEGYQFLESLLETAPFWQTQSLELITPYNKRPIKMDPLIQERLEAHLGAPWSDESVEKTRKEMARHIFAEELSADILCLQEANLIDSSLLPIDYQLVSDGAIALAFSKSRFQLVEVVNRVAKRSLTLLLEDQSNGNRVIASSLHLTGCNPYREGEDSTKGDWELTETLAAMEEIGADLYLIGMDSNVTSLHPRLVIPFQFGYQLDTEDVTPTCTNPHSLLHTRIDWIMVKAPHNPCKIIGIEMKSIGLNEMYSNISDHKPIYSKIKY